ncbi:MAG: nitroreductase family protein [Anaerococcus sp.]|nr:nitroreductase family protein [Anaerococcus sp.]
MEKIINHALNHRTIREFTDQKIDEDLVIKLLEVANHSASSNGLQLSSIIRIKDQAIKDKLASIGGQEYVKRAPEIWIFIVDLYRNYSIAKENSCENNTMINFDKFIQGFTDAIIQSQNVVSAAESLGLGTNYYGNIHNDTEKIINLLKLPKLTYPAVGLGFGYPNQKPQLKPRIPINLRVFDDSYHIFDDYSKEFEDYDREMTTYYDLRDANKRSDTFSLQIPKKQGTNISNRDKMFETLKNQGFIL